tara:strand:+ start:878 stop:1405 length:528 start_codon:yes stop_codon:yes gene_type:complete
MEMLKDFNIKKYLDKKPPSDNSFTTMQEVKELNNTPINKNFVKQKDNIKKAFTKIVDEGKFIQKLIDESAPLILKIKKHHDRPRPKKLAKKIGIKMEDVEMESMKTPSYPSGHSAQGVLVGMALSDKYPNKKTKLMKIAKDISKSRNIARAHYKSDSKFGEQIGKDMYNHIKNKI